MYTSIILVILCLSILLTPAVCVQYKAYYPHADVRCLKHCTTKNRKLATGLCARVSAGLCFQVIVCCWHLLELNPCTIMGVTAQWSVYSDKHVDLTSCWQIKIIGWFSSVDLLRLRLSGKQIVPLADTFFFFSPQRLDHIPHLVSLYNCTFITTVQSTGFSIRLFFFSCYSVLCCSNIMTSSMQRFNMKRFVNGRKTKC